MSKNKNDQIVSIRVPKGVPDELRTYTGVPFSTLVRHMVITLLNNERQKHAAARQNKGVQSDDNAE